MADHGASMLNYVALLAVVVLLVSPVVVTVAANQDRVSDAVERAICQILNLGDCPEDPGQQAAPDDEAFIPERCVVSSVSQHTASEISIGLFDLGGEYAFIEEHYADGSVSYTLVPKAMVGGSAGVGASLNAGPLFQIGAEAEIGAGVSYQLGSTWYFDSAEEAAQFRSDAEHLARRDRVHNYGGPVGGWLYDQVTDPPDLGSPDVTRESVEGHSSGDAAVFAGLGNDRSKRGRSGAEEWDVSSPRVEAGVGFHGRLSIQSTEYDHRNNTNSRIYEVEANAGARAPGADATVNRGGMVRVTEDNETGEIVELTLVQTVNDTVTTTTLPVTNDEERVIVMRWLGLLPDPGLQNPATDRGHPLAIYVAVADIAPQTLPEDASDFERLLFENGISHRNVYQEWDDSTNYGASVKIGAKLGLQLGWGPSGRDTVDSMYLGPNRGGYRDWQEFEDCVAVPAGAGGGGRW